MKPQAESYLNTMQNKTMITAIESLPAFFVWIEKNYNKAFVQQLNAAMRSKKYTDDFCKHITGKTFEQLWSEYGKNPSI